MESYKLTSDGLPQPPCGWCGERQHNESRKRAVSQARASQCNREAGRKLLHLTCSVTFSHMETLKLHRLRVVDHCGQVWMDIRGSTYVFIRCHPCLLIFYSDQALWTQKHASLSWWLQGGLIDSALGIREHLHKRRFRCKRPCCSLKD